MRMGPIDCPELSVRNCHKSLRNAREVRSSTLLRGESPQARKAIAVRTCKLLLRLLRIIRNKTKALKGTSSLMYL